MQKGVPCGCVWQGASDRSGPGSDFHTRSGCGARTPFAVVPFAVPTPPIGVGRAQRIHADGRERGGGRHSGPWRGVGAFGDGSWRSDEALGHRGSAGPRGAASGMSKTSAAGFLRYVHTHVQQAYARTRTTHRPVGHGPSSLCLNFSTRSNPQIEPQRAAHLPRTNPTRTPDARTTRAYKSSTSLTHNSTRTSLRYFTYHERHSGCELDLQLRNLQRFASWAGTGTRGEGPLFCYKIQDFLCNRINTPSPP